MITGEVDQRRTPVRARALVHPEIVWDCRRHVRQDRVRIGPTVPDGRVEVEIRGHTACSLAGEVAAFGGMVEVLEPAEVREHLAAIGAELARVYGGRAWSPGREPGGAEQPGASPGASPRPPSEPRGRDVHDHARGRAACPARAAPGARRRRRAWGERQPGVLLRRRPLRRARRPGRAGPRPRGRRRPPHRRRRRVRRDRPGSPAGRGGGRPGRPAGRAPGRRGGRRLRRHLEAARRGGRPRRRRAHHQRRQRAPGPLARGPLRGRRGGAGRDAHPWPSPSARSSRSTTTWSPTSSASSPSCSTPRLRREASRGRA